MAEHLAIGAEISLGKYLLGLGYHLMHQVATQLLKNEAVHTISGPWWLIQMWLNLYMHKIVRPNLQNLSFPSSNFDEEYRGKEGRTRQCADYHEAASAITIVVDVDHLFKKFYRGFDVDVLTWLPYDEDENNELVFPFKFRFESGCSDKMAAAIFNSFIKPCVLLAEFHHGRGKISTGSFLLGNLPTYEFYNPSFVAHQFGLGQLPPQLFFKNMHSPF